jgi:hypothetical protein
MKFILTRESYNEGLKYEYEILEDFMEIPEYKFKHFENFIKKTNKILQKINLPLIEIKEVKNEYKIFEEEKGRKIKVPIKFVSFTYPGKMNPDNGWELISIIDHDQKIVKSVSNHAPPEELVDLNKSHCDRCNKTIRRHRTLIIKNERSDEYLRVGGSCIKFYLGVNYDKFLAALDSIENLNSPEWIEGSDSDRPSYINNWDYYVFDRHRVLRVALNWLDKMPYVKRGSDDIPTSNIISSMFYAEYDIEDGSYSTYTEGELEKLEKYDKPHRLEQEIENFVKNLDPNDSNYNLNLTKMFEEKYITSAQFGLLVSIIPFYKRKYEQVSNIKNEYIGTVGEKYPFKELTVINIYQKEGDFGYYNIYIMEDPSRRRVVKYGTINDRYATDSTSNGIEKGTTLMFNAEIKSHSEYKGIKTTVIGRVSKYKI